LFRFLAFPITEANFLKSQAKTFFFILGPIRPDRTGVGCRGRLRAFFPPTPLPIFAKKTNRCPPLRLKKKKEKTQ